MYTWKKYHEGKHGGWAVYFPNGALVSVCMYRRGAVALCNLLNGYRATIMGR